ncbi:hypothetical protein OTU49_013105, partial [Cherax quadricarinatus]
GLFQLGDAATANRPSISSLFQSGDEVTTNQPIPGLSQSTDTLTTASVTTTSGHVITLTSAPRQESWDVYKQLLEAPTQCNYTVFAVDHTMTLAANTECSITRSGVTLSEREEILRVHNTLRAKVANGMEETGDEGPQPSGSDLRQLVWNEELAQVAQALASQCRRGHDGSNQRRICSRSYAVGQNIFRQWSFNSESVVWGTTHEIGCGAIYYPSTINGITFPHTKIYVCNYGPAGNYVGSRVYTIGLPASRCPSTSSQDYPGLCN